jgi:subtilase family serine protease
MTVLVSARSSLAFVLILSGLSIAANGQRNRAIAALDETQLVSLTGNTHPLARAKYDLGSVDAETRLDRMILVLMPTAAQQAELDLLVEAQQDAASSQYHQWLTPAEFGARFGASDLQLQQVTAWLTAHGFAIEEIAANHRLIVFSGTAAQVTETFHTAIHRYSIDGVEYIANAQDPQIPASLIGVVGGVVSLHNFRRTSAISSLRKVSAKQLRGPRAEYSAGATHYLFPADFATIYNLNALYAKGINGAGISIAIVGRSNINVSDVAAFRVTSGLAANNPTVLVPATNPGLVGGDQDEATLDVEWSGAVAPAAQVILVVQASTATTDGVDLASQYIVNHATASVVSVSYGSCEQAMGVAEQAFYGGLWQQAASQGMSVFVAAGDAGAAGCNIGADAVGAGTGVNGLCSSPYSTCVGGTEFNEGQDYADYWAAANSPGNASALSYIPEEVWNESGANGGSGLWASGGGVSAIYAQPSWQRGVGATAAAEDTAGMRTVPDVAMAAADHDGFVIYENDSYWVIAGTSASSPSFAAVIALVVQKQGSTGLGNANPELYALGNAVHNPFHATRSGDNTVPGVAGFTATGTAYNLATGLGSVDGAILVSAWGGGSLLAKPGPVRGPVRQRCALCVAR